MNAALGLRFAPDFFRAAGLRLIFFAGFLAAFLDFFFVAIFKPPLACRLRDLDRLASPPLASGSATRGCPKRGPSCKRFFVSGGGLRAPRRRSCKLVLARRRRR
jgi:hypothetical protein